LELGVNRWGEFSNYTFELAVSLLRYVKDSKKEGKLILLVDDLVELPQKQKEDRFVRVDTKWKQKARKRFYPLNELPESYLTVLENYNFSERDFVVQQRTIESNSIFISEKMARARALERGYTAPNECSQAYKGVIYDPEFFVVANDYLVSFIPGQCKGNVCSGILDVQNDLDTLHVFFPHMEDLGGLADMREGYKKIRNSLTIDEIYQRGVFYVKKEANISKK
jgi:hypothetical protein